MKNQSLLRTLLYIPVLLSFAAVPGSAESPQTVTVSMRPYKGTRSVVAVKVNGTGPYDFMVDTGATVTVLDTAMFDELGLRGEGTSKVTSPGGATIQISSVAKEVTLDCLSVQNITVVSMESPMIESDYRSVRGILGENFLRHFDILIDNQHRKMTLGAGDGLADSLAGERLPITFPPLPQGRENRYRPMISARTQRYGHARLLLDSGAASLVLLQWGNQMNGFGDGMRLRTVKKLRTVNGSMPCESTNDRLFLGKGTVSDLPMESCQSDIVKPKDSEGILPTAIFKQIFISHAGSYAIINPARRLNVAREIAVVTPMSQ
jgi:predicted aspartyl protease